MKFTLKKPCPQCPFRSDIPPLLMNARVAEMVTAILENDLDFACHKTNRYDEQGEPLDTDEVQFCAGAMILLQKLGRSHQTLEQARRQGLFNPADLDLTAPVYESKEKMISSAGERFLRTGPDLI